MTKSPAWIARKDGDERIHTTLEETDANFLDDLDATVSVPRVVGRL